MAAHADAARREVGQAGDPYPHRRCAPAPQAHRGRRKLGRSIRDANRPGQAVSRGGRGAVAAWLILIAACAYWLTQRLVLTTDMSAFLPQAATPAQEILIGQMRSGVTS